MTSIDQSHFFICHIDYWNIFECDVKQKKQTSLVFEWPHQGKLIMDYATRKGF